jgi:hypothetical protein
MDYERLEEAGILEIEVRGGPLDAYAIGVLHLNVQDITDKLALWLLSEEGLLDPTWRRPRNLPAKYVWGYPRLLRARIDRVREGSFIEAVSFWVAEAVRDPTVAAVLVGIASNFVWALGHSGVRGIVSHFAKPPSDRPPVRRTDPVAVAPNAREIVVVFADGHDSPIEIIFRAHGPQNEHQETMISIGKRRTDAEHNRDQHK